MFINKPAPLQKRVASNKKAHRRVVTEATEMPQHLHPRKQIKKAQRVITKPKDIDYSKRQLMAAENEPFTSYKHFKAQADQMVKTNANSVHTQRPQVPVNIYEVQGVAGKGTFGMVYFGVNRSTGQKVAIKKVFQNKKYKNREDTILKMLKHPNNLQMRQSFISTQGEEQYLNIVMDYFPDNLYQLIKNKEITPTLTKIYLYQIFRGLNYLSMLSIAHRDIKPHNILVDKDKQLVVISDFGSAKQLVKGETNLAYVCSRCHRAPELIFGATDYTPQIDMWSTGCVLVEMINGAPPFMGDSQLNQLLEIIKVLGTPTKIEMGEMNKVYDMKEYKKIPKIKSNPWKNLLQTQDPLLIDLVTKILQYSPIRRLTPAAALYHEYFDELRQEDKHQQLLFTTNCVPNLFDYMQDQIDFITQTTKRNFELVPPWANKKTVSLPSQNRTQLVCRSKSPS